MGEARQNLSVLLQFVADGHEILITDRGKPVARLVPPLPLSPKPFRDPTELRGKLPELAETVSSALVEVPLRFPLPFPAETEIAGPLYLDGSSLAKIYLPESGSGDLGGLLDGRRDLTIADLAITEIVTAFRRRLGNVSAAQRSQWSATLHAALIRDLDGGRFRRIELSPSAYRAAERVALSLGPTLVLRPRQVLHLALAMTAGVSGIVTFDAELTEATRALGLRAWPGPAGG